VKRLQVVSEFTGCFYTMLKCMCVEVWVLHYKVIELVF